MPHMPQNLADLKLTDAEAAAILGALETIRTTLGARAVSLSPEQRGSLVKMGEGTQPFCEQTLVALQANAASLPADLPVAAAAQDMADYKKLAPVCAEFLSVGELLDDTLKALGSDIMTTCIVGAAFLKTLNKLKPGLDGTLKNLTSIRRRKPAKKKATPKP